MGTVAGAEPATKVTSLADWHTTQMCAYACYMSVQVVSDARVMSLFPVPGLAGAWRLPVGEMVGVVLTQHDQPLRLLHTVVILLGIP